MEYKSIKEAFETIVLFCKAKDTCTGCPFFNESTEICRFALCDLPCDWSMEGVSDG